MGPNIPDLDTRDGKKLGTFSLGLALVPLSSAFERSN